jgi:hypothetical protein
MGAVTKTCGAVGLKTAARHMNWVTVGRIRNPSAFLKIEAWIPGAGSPSQVAVNFQAEPGLPDIRQVCRKLGKPRPERSNAMGRLGRADLHAED